MIEDGRIRFLMSGRQLEIQNSRIEDTADYTCVATNVAGEAKLKYKLNVWGEWKFPLFHGKFLLFNVLPTPRNLEL